MQKAQAPLKSMQENTQERNRAGPSGHGLGGAMTRISFAVPDYNDVQLAIG